jgi:3-hydroxyisobutyrate dehydrogenase-like beta-hydroxyacid dehydrogenase
MDDVSATVGLIGLGIMGSAMAGHLERAGFKVVGYDIDPTKKDALAASGGIAAGSPREVAHQADIIVTVLPSAATLGAVLAGEDGLIAACNQQLLVADCGTFDLADKEACRRTLEAAGMAMLDCTISGTGAQAKTKDLVVYASGELSEYVRCVASFSGFARASHYVGEFGSGSKMKYVANLLVAIHTVAAAEAMVLAQRAGLDLSKVYDLIRAGAGNSRMFELRAPLMVTGEYEKDVASRIDLWQKDMQVIGRYARELNCAVPLFAASSQVYNAAVAHGYGNADMAAVCAALERLAGIER